MIAQEIHGMIPRNRCLLGVSSCSSSGSNYCHNFCFLVHYGLIGGLFALRIFGFVLSGFPRAVCYINKNNR